jgi:hypothetical protein
MPMQDERAPGRRVSPSGEDLRAVIDEFGRLLAIFGSQLADSLQEADREYVVVGDAFHEIAAAKTAIAAVDCPQPQKAQLQHETRRIEDSLHAAIVALQYHDRLAQRLGHIRTGLDHLKTLLRDGKDRSNAEWLQLLQNVERAHHVEQQRLIGIDSGADSAGASAPAAKGTVELF